MLEIRLFKIGESQTLLAYNQKADLYNLQAGFIT